MRRLVSLALAFATALFGFTASMGITRSLLAATLIAATVATLVAWGTFRHPIIALDERACSRGLKVVALVATLAAFGMLVRQTVFTVDPSRVSYALASSSVWDTQHSCLSAYAVAAEAASAHRNVYDASLYALPDDDPGSPRKSRSIGPFKIDTFEYPPPFLFLPRALRLLTPAFLDLRMLWFALDGGLLLLALVIVARFMGPTFGTRALLFSPLVWAAVPTVSTLQKGNVQAMVIAASMIAMVLFERRRFASGGLVLAFATVSKLYPGLLVVYLLARRQWRAAIWTTAMSVALTVLTIVDLGWASFVDFLHHLPGLVGGEAFPAFRFPPATAVNLSIPGLAFKLKLFGVPGMGFGAAKILGWIFTPIALAVTVLAARRPQSTAEKPLLWLAILLLATLRSPFLPVAYGVFPGLWLVTLLAATAPPNARTLVWTLVAWATLNIYWPLDWPLDPRVLALAMLLPQTLMIVLVVLALRRRLPRASESPSPDEIPPAAKERRAVEIDVGSRAGDRQLRRRVPSRAGLIGKRRAEADVQAGHVLVAQDLAGGRADSDVGAEHQHAHAVAVL